MINKLINFYQLYISTLLHSLTGATHACRFAPTCSEYAKLAVQKHGLFAGTLKAIWRLIRCNPLSKPRVDYP